MDRPSGLSPFKPRQHSNVIRAPIVPNLGLYHFLFRPVLVPGGLLTSRRCRLSALQIAGKTEWSSLIIFFLTPSFNAAILTT